MSLERESIDCTHTETDRDRARVADMGALAPLSRWIPEDDLLLKNAVEAGASLESLAKGAVQFSRRFTVQELQERWHSLLYDPVVSLEASARMIEFERSASTLPTKSNRFENEKENKCVSGKRKAESVRKCYYAMRKRICNEPFDSMDLSFLVAPGTNNYVANGDKPPSDSIHAFPELGSGDAAATGVGITAHAFYAGLHNPIEEDLPVEQNNICRVFEDDLSLNENCSAVGELGQPKELPVCSLFEADDLGAKPATTFDQINVNEGNKCAEFVGGQVFSSPVSDCDVSFHYFGYSSPLPEMPIWNTIEGVSAPMLPDVHLGEERHTGNAFALPDVGDANNTNTSEYDAIYTDSKLENQMSSVNLKTSNSTPCTDDYLAELSNSLLNFTNEEELLFIDADGKDTIDKSYIDGLSSLLLDSPNDDEISNRTVPEASVAPDEHLPIPGGAQSVGSGDKPWNHCADGHIAWSSTRVLPSASAVNPEFPELRNGVICCMFNTEDPEIPCNEDVFFSNWMPSSSLSSSTQWTFYEANYPTSWSVKDFSGSQKTNDGGPNLLRREQNNYEQSHLSSQTVGSRLLSEASLNHPVGEHGVKSDLSISNTQNMALRNAISACGGPNQISSANLSTNCFLPGTVKQDVANIEQATHPTYNSSHSYTEKQAYGFDGLESCPQKNSNSSKLEIDAPAIARKQEVLHAELDSIEMTDAEPVLNLSPSDQEFPSQSDDDVPYFSDVEAMILDMDLSPDDQDLYFCREVSRYQHKDTKRAIMRLEQAAESYMQRAIASQGAFAVLYGRHSKHYIKKPGVLLGRETEDVNVDIDLGREGRANKVSRRQATIKMDSSGIFHLKNLGRCSIFVNSKEVAPKQSLSLTSSCLIEVRGMPFIFETNQTHIKQYVDRITTGSQTLG